MRVIAVALVMVALACGGRDPGPAPEPSTSGPPPTNPPPSAPPADPPSGDPPPDDPPPAPPNTSLALDRLDDGGDCAGVVPDRAPAPVSMTRTAPAGFVCAAAVSDGTGHVAAGAVDASGAASWQVFGPDGAPAHAFETSGGAALLAEPSGWHGLTVTTPADDSGKVVAHTAFGADGSPLRQDRVSDDPTLVSTSRWSLSEDPRGGCYVLVDEMDRFHNHWSAVRALRFDDAGVPVSPAQQFGFRSDRILFVAGGVSRKGESLAVWQQSAWVDVQWTAADGTMGLRQDLAERQSNALGPAGLTPDVRLTPLLDGGLAVRVDGSYRRMYAHLALTTSPLPDWLAVHPTWTYRFTRGNRGYAVLPPPGEASDDCSQAIELRSPSGRLCGRVVLRAARPGACSTGAVDQGWDGTVVQQARQGDCTWRAWPRLLASP